MASSEMPRCQRQSPLDSCHMNTWSLLNGCSPSFAAIAVPLISERRSLGLPKPSVLSSHLCNVERGYPAFLPLPMVCCQVLPPQWPHNHPLYSHNLTDQACDSPYTETPAILVICGLSLSVWVSNILRALFRQMYRINSSDQIGTLQRSGGMKVIVVEGPRKGFFLSLSFTLILVEAKSILK